MYKDLTNMKVDCSVVKAPTAQLCIFFAVE